MLIHARKFRVISPLRIAIAGTWIFVSVFWATAAGQDVTDLRASGGDTLAQDRGKIQVLIFVRSDCPISNSYAPLLQQMHQKYGQKVAFRLVFPDRNESQEKIRNYLREYRYDIPAIRDLDHTLVKRTAAKVTPEAAVFNASGQLIYHGRIDNLYEHIGQARRSATTHELADAIDAATKSTKPPVTSVDAVGCFISDLE